MRPCEGDMGSQKPADMDLESKSLACLLAEQTGFVFTGQKRRR